MVLQPHPLHLCGACSVKKAHGECATQPKGVWPDDFAVIRDASEHSELTAMSAKLLSSAGVLSSMSSSAVWHGVHLEFLLTNSSRT